MTTDKDDASNDDEPKGSRSPAFPAIDLERAVALAATLYEQAHMNGVRPMVVAKMWGYGEKSSGGRLALSALRKYGLIEGDGRAGELEVRLTPRAQRILALADPSQAAERVQHLRDAALAPELHRDLVGKFPKLPTDAVLASHLEIDKGFPKARTKDVIGVFRRTLAYAKVDGVATIAPPRDELSTAESAQPMTTMASPAPASAAVPPGGPTASALAGKPVRPRSEFRLPLGGGELAALNVPYPLTDAEWTTMNAILVAMKAGMVQGASPQPLASPTHRTNERN